MLKNRTFLLLTLSAGLVWSPAILSKNGTVIDGAVEQTAAVQLTMLTGTTDSTKNDAASSTDIGIEPLTDDSDVRASSAANSITKQISEEQLAEQRQLFLQAESAIKKRHNKKYLRLSEQLEDYPLYPYLQYQWLKKNISRDAEIKQFLDQHKSSRYASKLKHRWLHQLAKKRKWQTFLDYYTTSSNTSLKCNFHRAQYNTGDKKSALEGARKLWSAGYSQPKACDPIFAQLKKSELFNQELLWTRFDATLRNNKTSLAKYIKKLMPSAEQKTAAFWLKLHRDPERYIPILLNKTETAQTPLMFSHAINRLAGKDINHAIELWDANKHQFTISKNQLDKLEKRLAFKLVYKKESGAYERLGQLNESDKNSKTWRIRVALSEQTWPRVISAIKDLDEEEQQQEKWQYWLARAYQETGKPIQADEILTRLSTKRDFYGYMAADNINSLYQLADNPVDVSAEEIDAIKYNIEFQVAHELMLLDRKQEAKLQWWHALKTLQKKEITAAAKLAQQWNWDEIAIFTIAKVKQWDDIEMRFPLSYADKIHENAELQNLNPVILFGLVRRESAFNKDAHSPVGARGLMQIMPQTGRQIAKDLNERWSGKNSLYNPVKNLKYGSYYYQKLLNQFDGNYALALAAYNAGPSRVKKWLPDESIPADIWIETIPYRETRNYVTSVLVYAMIYQQRMQSNELTMNDLTREVKPLNNIAASL